MRNGALARTCRCSRACGGSEELSLRWTSLRGDGIAGLAESPRLRSLDVADTGVGAAAVEPLVSHGGMESLWLDWTDLSLEEVRRIARTNPRLTFLRPPGDREIGDALRDESPWLRRGGCGYRRGSNSIEQVRAVRARADATTPLMDAVMRRDHAQIDALIAWGVEVDRLSPRRRAAPRRRRRGVAVDAVRLGARRPGPARLEEP